MVVAEAFDYVIAGGGTAGCVLAARLSEDPSVRVLVLEAGPNPGSLWIRMPAGMGRLFVNPAYNWCFTGIPEAQLAGRAMYLPQGRVLGGSSCINGMAYVRGHAEDYDRWRELGNAGWGWSDVLPYFIRLERRDEARGPLRGRDGPLCVSDPRYRHPSSTAFVEAAIRAGLPANDDYNGASQEGASFLQYTIREGRRDSAYSAYLRPALGRANLVVRSGAQVQRVLLEAGRASGVEYLLGGRVQQVAATREVILAAGAIGSPRILLHSGIGPAAVLRRGGVPVALELPGVGQNLIDHPYVHMTFGTTVPAASLNRHLRGWRVALHGVRWLLGGSGPLTIGASQAAAFVKRPGQPRPDLQINFRPISFTFDASGRLGPDLEGRVTAAICALQPRSRGSVEIASNDPATPPVIRCGYLEDPADLEALVDGVRWARRVFAAEPLRARIRSEDSPGPGVRTEEELGDFVRRTTQTMCHPVGTCRMGRDDLAVVDERLRVRGVAGLHVVDASVMPMIVSGNTMAAAFMIAEKGADLIRARAS